MACSKQCRPAGRLSSGWLLVVIFIACSLSMHGASAWADDQSPLMPVATYSPRETLDSFLTNANKSYEEYLRSGYRSQSVLAYNHRAAHCLDLSKIAPSIVDDVAYESVLLLKEILDRIDVPLLSAVPDQSDLSYKKIDQWRMPKTEIVIAKIKDGPRQGEFLFSSHTVRKLKDFYQKIRHLPDKQGRSTAVYEEYIYSPGWMIPVKLINSLPEWTKIGYGGQALWQWIALVLLLGGNGCLLAIIHFYSRRSMHLWVNTDESIHWGRLISPVSIMLVASATAYLTDRQINITGQVLAVVIMALDSLFYIAAGWVIMIVGGIVATIIIKVPKIKPRSIDADLIRLVVHLLSLVGIFVLFYHAADEFGIPVTAVFASAGVAGVAVALAARETLANFFGGITIFLDRPFKAGDYIVLDDGKRGEVRQVGIRSTRIQTRDDVMITIPNSVITNVKVVNESAPYPEYRIRVKIGVAYGSDIDLVEQTLLDLAGSQSLVAPAPAPRVRFRAFGDSSWDFELLCWAKRPHDRGRLTHELNRVIYKSFNEKGIVMPFPQRDVYLHRT